MLLLQLHWLFCWCAICNFLSILVDILTEMSTSEIVCNNQMKLLFKYYTFLWLKKSCRFSMYEMWHKETEWENLCFYKKKKVSKPLFLVTLPHRPYLPRLDWPRACPSNDRQRASWAMDAEVGLAKREKDKRAVLWDQVKHRAKVNPQTTTKAPKSTISLPISHITDII